MTKAEIVNARIINGMVDFPFTVYRVLSLNRETSGRIQVMFVIKPTVKILNDDLLHKKGMFFKVEDIIVFKVICAFFITGRSI